MPQGPPVKWANSASSSWVQCRSSGHQTRAGAAGTPCPSRVGRRVRHAGIVCEAEIVVASQIKDRLTLQTRMQGPPEAGLVSPGHGSANSLQAHPATPFACTPRTSTPSGSDGRRGAAYWSSGRPAGRHLTSSSLERRRTLVTASSGIGCRMQ